MEIRKGRPQVDVAALYQRGLSMREISEIAGVTRQAIHKRLIDAGIARTRRIGKISRPCDQCGTEFLARRRSRMSSDTRSRFCSLTCARAYLSNPAYKASRAGLMRARAKVSHHFALNAVHVVHHIDGNQSNNALVNLAVFASQSDHLKSHHANPKAKPIWSGASCRCDLCRLLKDSAE